jgi:tetratricopeptide (TPR) repeat protein
MRRFEGWALGAIGLLLIGVWAEKNISAALLLRAARPYMQDLKDQSLIQETIGTPAVVWLSPRFREVTPDRRVTSYEVQGPRGAGVLFLIEVRVGTDWVLARIDLARRGERARAPVVNTEQLADRGWDYADAGELDKAFAAFELALQLDPQDVWAFQNRALTYAAAGRTDSALEDFTQALALAPSEPSIYSGRGQVWAQLNQDRKAIADFERAIVLDPADPDPYCLLAVLYRVEGRPGLAQRVRDRLEAARRVYGIGSDEITAAQKFGDDFDRSLQEEEPEP